jgi:VWFA-related protein
MRRYTSLLATVLAFGLLVQTLAQQPSPPPQSEDDEEVVRITTNLVQVDAVVTDNDGRHVTDLRPEEFEILEEGKRQEITSFSYVNLESRTPARTDVPEAPRAEKGAPPPPPARPNASRARRTVALVVDDLSLPYENVHYVRRALKKYVDEQLQDGDLSAVLRVSSGVGVLQQFTADKRLLDAAVERVRWSPRSRGEANPINNVLAADGGSAGGESGVDAEKAVTVDEIHSEFSVGDTISALNYVVRGFQSIPGRKAVVLFTQDLPILNGFGATSNLERLRHLIDLANRSSVVFYVIDTRGVQPLDETAAEAGQKLRLGSQVAVGGLAGQGSRRVDAGMQTLTGKASAIHKSQDGMDFLAKQTGGIFFKNQNNFNRGLERVLEDQRGYYLIGYRPDESTFDPRTGQHKFRNLKVNVKRPGVTVRSRTGFYGVADEKEKKKPRTASQELLDALSSPFGSNGVDLRLAALFLDDPTRGSAIRSVVHLKASDLEFKEEAAGKRKATLDVIAAVFASDGHPAVQGSERRDVILSEQEYQRALKDGLTYRLNVPVSRPGAYNMRVAVRDASTGRTGSAREFIVVPDLRKGPLSLSSVILAGVDPAQAGAVTAAEQLTTSAGVAAEAADPGLSPAVRRLRHGVFLDYGYAIYNARLDKATGQPRLTTQVRLFKDGKLVFAGGVTPLDVSGQTDMKRLAAGGRLQVGSELTPGDYVLQVVVTDEIVRGKNKDGRGTTTQWVDFEVVGGPRG